MPPQVNFIKDSDSQIVLIQFVSVFLLALSTTSNNQILLLIENKSNSFVLLDATIWTSKKEKKMNQFIQLFIPLLLQPYGAVPPPPTQQQVQHQIDIDY